MSIRLQARLRRLMQPRLSAPLSQSLNHVTFASTELPASNRVRIPTALAKGSSQSSGPEGSEESTGLVVLQLAATDQAVVGRREKRTFQMRASPWAGMTYKRTRCKSGRKRRQIMLE